MTEKLCIVDKDPEECRRLRLSWSGTLYRWFTGLRSEKQLGRAQKAYDELQEASKSPVCLGCPLHNTHDSYGADRMNRPE